MNPQMSFNKVGLTDGQYDKYEGAITDIPCKILYSTDEKKTWHLLGDTSLIHKNNKYYYVIPWKYIEPLWQGSL